MHTWTDAWPTAAHAARLAATRDTLLTAHHDAVAATRHVTDAIEAAQLHRERAAAARAQARAAGWTNRQLDELGCPPLREITWEPHELHTGRPRPGAG